MTRGAPEYKDTSAVNDLEPEENLGAIIFIHQSRWLITQTLSALRYATGPTQTARYELFVFEFLIGYWLITVRAHLLLLWFVFGVFIYKTVPAYTDCLPAVRAHLS